MSLSTQIKTQAPGWTVRRLAERLGYSEQGLYKMYHTKPERIELWIKGLQKELQSDTRR